MAAGKLDSFPGICHARLLRISILGACSVLSPTRAEHSVKLWANVTDLGSWLVPIQLYHPYLPKLLNPSVSFPSCKMVDLALANSKNSRYVSYSFYFLHFMDNPRLRKAK